jgi:broad specificity phosphatase PhoE
MAMSYISADIQVWFLRHGKPRFNSKTDNYYDFMEMLCDGYSKALLANPEIDFKSLPKQVDFVGYSRFTRTFETAELLRNKIGVKHMEEIPSLDEVRFDKDIIGANEYISLKQIRPKVLERWYNCENKAESFNDSLTRVKEIESFLSKRSENRIILITHGWFLRILDLYFVQGNHTPTITDLQDVKPIPFGHSIMAKVPRKRLVEA